MNKKHLLKIDWVKQTVEDLLYRLQDGENITSINVDIQQGSIAYVTDIINENVDVAGDDETKEVNIRIRIE